MQADFWGVRDCVVRAAEHCVALGSPDWWADMRGTYATAVDAARIVRDAGGMTALIAGRIGWPEADADRGEVAVLPGRPFDGVAVRSGAFWAMPGEEGEVEIRADLVKPLACWAPA